MSCNCKHQVLHNIPVSHAPQASAPSPAEMEEASSAKGVATAMADEGIRSRTSKTRTDESGAKPASVQSRLSSLETRNDKLEKGFSELKDQVEKNAGYILKRVLKGKSPGGGLTGKTLHEFEEKITEQGEDRNRVLPDNTEILSKYDWDAPDYDLSMPDLLGVLGYIYSHSFGLAGAIVVGVGRSES